MIDKTLQDLEEEIHEIRQAEQPIQKYWAQISALAVLVFGLGGAYVKIDALADDVAKAQVQAEGNTKDAQIVAQRLVRIEANQETTKRDIDELKQQSDKLDEKLDKILEEIRKQ